MELYALCDIALLRKKGITIEAFCERANALDAKLIQYRVKFGHPDAIISDLRYMRNACSNTPIIVNDYIAMAEHCDGLHMGQEDFSAINRDFSITVEEIKKCMGEEKLLGLSTHNAQEIKLANALDVDYIGLGAFRDTSTKRDARVLGESLDALASLSIHDVAAIGGVRLDDHFENARYLVIGSALYED